MSRKKPKPAFSATKAVKANARERVGQPKPARVIAERPADGARASKRRPTMAQILAEPDQV